MFTFFYFYLRNFKFDVSSPKFVREDLSLRNFLKQGGLEFSHKKWGLLTLTGLF